MVSTIKGVKLSCCPNSQNVIWDRVENTVRQARCNKNNCPYCGPLNRWKRVEDIEYGVEGLYRLGDYLTFFTLTLSYDSDIDMIMKYWNRYRAFLLRCGYKQEYVITIEYKHGLAHIHGIGNKFIPHQIIQAAWWAATEHTAWKVDVRAVRMNRLPSRYLAKYINKGSHDPIKRHKRGINFSRNFPRRPRAVKEPGRYLWLTYDDYNTIKGMLYREETYDVDKTGTGLEKQEITIIHTPCTQGATYQDSP